jgi:hypothetical protein
MNFETTTECSCDMVNHKISLQKPRNNTTNIFQVLHYNEKNSKMDFETSTECNSDKVNHDTTLQKYSKS